MDFAIRIIPIIPKKTAKNLGKMKSLNNPILVEAIDYLRYIHIIQDPKY